MIKVRLGIASRSTKTAQINEALCKVLCHNICVVIQSIYELGIDPTFGLTHMGLLADILKEIPLSVVLRERISTAEAENGALKTENAILKDDLRQAKEENRRLKNEIGELTHPIVLDEAKTQLLVILAKRTRQISLNDFLGMIEIEGVHLEYHLHELIRQQCVTATRSQFPHPPYYSLKKGREYLLEKSLV